MAFEGSVLTSPIVAEWLAERKPQTHLVLCFVCLSHFLRSSVANWDSPATTLLVATGFFMRGHISAGQLSQAHLIENHRRNKKPSHAVGDRSLSPRKRTTS